MICAIYERRPVYQRTPTDPRAARPVGQIKFKDQGRHHENVELIKKELEKDGLIMASTPNKVEHTEYDFVVYVEPSKTTSPQSGAQAKKKAVKVVGAGGISRKLPLPKRKR